VAVTIRVLVGLALIVATGKGIGAASHADISMNSPANKIIKSRFICILGLPAFDVTVVITTGHNNKKGLAQTKPSDAKSAK
jgi:hypothetical protein